MDILTRSMMGLVISLSLLFAGVAVADSPIKIDAPDKHSVEVKGKITLYRVQTEGMNFGEGKEKVNAEVIVTLDSRPGMVYTLALHDSNNRVSVVNQEMSKTLRTAYVNKLPVTLYRQIAMDKRSNFKILMVQLN